MQQGCHAVTNIWLSTSFVQILLARTNGSVLIPGSCQCYRSSPYLCCQWGALTSGFFFFAVTLQPSHSPKN
uniref:Putative secreted protein n=1 Tax=Anopheles darlingi TaxID=43151 RepID=A0A2M4D9M1_ANODA